MSVTNPAIFNARALPMDGSDSHVQPGNHIRVMHNPALGLPVTPFIIERLVVANRDLLTTRNDVIFTDSRGNNLTLPFNVSVSNPVTARLVLAPGETCIWAKIIGKPTNTIGPFIPGPLIPVPVTPGPVVPRPVKPGAVIQTPIIGRPINTQSVLSQPIKTPVKNVKLGPIMRTEAVRRGDVKTRRPFRRQRMSCEAFGNSAMGPTPLMRRNAPPYSFSAPGIVEVVIMGRGEVTGVEWIEASDQEDLEFAPYDIMNLPHSGGPRYLPMSNHMHRPQQRVQSQAPKRKPLQETVNSPPPALAASASMQDEEQRVTSLTSELQDDLHSLITDMSTPQLSQNISNDIIDDKGVVIGTSSVARMHRVMQHVVDPGTASFLGYMHRDSEWGAEDDSLVFYRVTGFFERPVLGTDPDASEILLNDLIGGTQGGDSGGQILSPKDIIELFIHNVPHEVREEVSRRGLGNFKPSRSMRVSTIMAADRSAIPARPLPPKITSTQHIDWIPAIPPEARREIEVCVSGVHCGGIIAAGKITPANGGDYAALNKVNAGNYHLPIVLSLRTQNSNNTPIAQPGTGFIMDRDAGAPAIQYKLTHQDRFGRWSNWVAKNAVAGVRPKPPIPQFHAFYTQPDLTTADISGGEVYVKVAIPHETSLAPGSHLLQALELYSEDLTLLATTTITEAEANKIQDPGYVPPPNPPTFPPECLPIRFTGPVLSAIEMRQLKLTAKWIDTAGQKSELSLPQTLKMYDPRPPAQLTVPSQLLYSARPDVTGQAWIEHRWTPQASHINYGIYYTDENRLLAFLRGLSDLLTLIEEESDAARRSDLFQTISYPNNISSENQMLAFLEAHRDLLAQIEAETNDAQRSDLYKTVIYPDNIYERLQDVQISFQSGEIGYRHAVSGSFGLLSFYKIAAEAETGARPELAGLPMIAYGVPNSDPPARPTLNVSPAAYDPGLDPSEFCVNVAIKIEGGATPPKNWRLRRSRISASNLAKMPIVSTGDLAQPSPDDIQSRLILPAQQDSMLIGKYRDNGSAVIAPHAQLSPWTKYSWVAEIQGAPESGTENSVTPVEGRWSRASDPVSLILVPSAPPIDPVIDTIIVSPIGGPGSGMAQAAFEISASQELSGGNFGDFKIQVSRQMNGESKTIFNRVVNGAGPFHLISEDEPDAILTDQVEYAVSITDPLGRQSGIVRQIVN